MLAGGAALVAAVAIDILAHWQAGLRPTESAYAATVYMGGVLNGQLAAAVAIMTLFALARHVTGRLDGERRVTFESAALLTYYTAGQELLGLVLVHGFPRLVG
jgi:cytochrome c oxidase subunit I+III